MFADTHFMDVTRLTTLAHPLSSIFLLIPFLYLLALTPTPTTCLFRSLRDRWKPNKTLTPAGNPRLDERLFLGIMAGTFVLLQSNVAHTIYVFAVLSCLPFVHRPL
ncbi:MAG TPA: hypothetical protein VN734_06590 [Acidobacteriaceae bacterium]|nr:hypothetical protein [Acidobacteriaceae bacterium]